MSAKISMPLCAAALLAACGPADDQTHITGRVIQTVPGGANSAVTATLTRSGKLYRLYLEAPGLGPQKIIQSEQPHDLRISWSGPGTVMLEGLCGGEVRYPLSNSYRYPWPDAEHGVGAGFSNRCD